MFKEKTKENNKMNIQCGFCLNKILFTEKKELKLHALIDWIKQKGFFFSADCIELEYSSPTKKKYKRKVQSESLSLC